MDMLCLSFPDWLLFLSLLGLLFYLWATKTFNKFKDQGIPGPKPYPIIGTAWPFFTEGVLSSEKRRYKEYCSEKCYGVFLGRQPILVLMDDEMLSEILVKQFWKFSDRRSRSDGSELNDSFITVLKGEHWKRVRNLLTPTFTSGKLKMMMKQLNKCGKQYVDNIANLAKTSGDFDSKRVSSCFTMDVIGATAFGLEVNSLQDPENIFVKMGTKIFTASLTSPVLLVALFFPFLLPILRKFGIQMMKMDCVEFFTKVIAEAIKERKENPNTKKMDFVQLMINAEETEAGSAAPSESEKSEHKKAGLKNIEILAQGLLFFLAGFDTTAQTLAFILYSVATQPEVQEKLYEEIQATVGDKEDVEYSDISNMHYLEMCIEETMRLYPIAVAVDRVCTEDVTIKGVDFKKGDVVAVPVLGLHFDETRWSNPEEFNPERFAAEAKKSRGPFDWMPFGYGPRNCIGIRLALLEMKVALIHLIRGLRLFPSSKTQIPLQMDKIGMRVKDGIWMAAEERKLENKN